MATNRKFGGHMEVRLSSGEPLVMRAEGDFTVETNTLEASAQVNQNGSIDQVLTPKTVKFMSDFTDNNLALDKILGKTGLNVTIREKEAKVTHLFSNGFFTGSPQTNRKTGAITGMTFEAASYRRLV